MNVRSKLGAVRGKLLCSIYERLVPLRNEGPLVSFCFDDFPRTAYTTGGTILESFGVHGTYYAAMGLMDTTNDLGDQLGHKDLDALLKNGHELGSHTFNHVSCRNVPLRSFEDEVRKGRTTIRALMGYDAANFAYPYGHVSLGSKKSIGRQMDCCRGIYRGINETMVDLNLLRANSLYGDLDQSKTYEALLSENVRKRGWLIFYTHDVRANPSPYGCTPALLDRVLSLAQKKGSRIASIKEAVSLLDRPSNLPATS